jgi:hypothetical protein
MNTSTMTPQVKKVRPCYSIHCRHYDLTDGQMCEVEYQREIARDVFNAAIKIHSDQKTA